MRPSDIDGETTLLMRRPAAWQPKRPSAARRVCSQIIGGLWSFIDSFRDPRLDDYLPPVPDRPAREDTLVCEGGIPQAERGERLLLEIVRVPPEYLRGVAALVEYAEHWHERGPIAVEDGLVHLALSRIRPDHHGEIPISWLERKLEGVPSYVVTRALRRLAQDGAIEVLPAREGDVGARLYEELRGYLGRVKLRRPL